VPLVELDVWAGRVGSRDERSAFGADDVCWGRGGGEAEAEEKVGVDGVGVEGWGGGEEEGTVVLDIKKMVKAVERRMKRMARKKRDEESQKS
jgi:hypothetical protein